MKWTEAYQQIREHHYGILDERESISKSARLSLSTWVLELLTECLDEAEQTEPTCSKMEQVEDEPQTCSVNGRPYTDCCNCEYFKCTADEPQTERNNNG